MSFRKLSTIILNPTETAYEKMMEAVTNTKNYIEAVPTVDIRNTMVNEEALKGNRRFNLPFYWVKVKSK